MSDPVEQIVKRIFYEELRVATEIQRRMEGNHIIQASPYEPRKRTAERTGLTVKRVIELVPMAAMPGE